MIVIQVPGPCGIVPAGVAAAADPRGAASPGLRFGGRIDAGTVPPLPVGEGAPVVSSQQRAAFGRLRSQRLGVCFGELSTASWFRKGNAADIVPCRAVPCRLG